MSKPRSKYSFLGRLNVEDLYNAFMGLEERQQLLILVGSVFFVLLLLFLPISCASSKLGKLEKDYERSQKSRNEFMGRIATYQSNKAMLADMRTKMEASNQGGSLSAHIEGIASELGIKEGIESLKPINLGSTEFYDEEGIDGVISKVNLQQVTQLLYKLENHPTMPLKVKKLQIKPRYGRRDELTAIFQVSSIKLKENNE